MFIICKIFTRTDNFFFSFVKQIQEVSVNKMLMRYYYAF